MFWRRKRRRFVRFHFPSLDCVSLFQRNLSPGNTVKPQQQFCIDLHCFRHGLLFVNHFQFVCQDLISPQRLTQDLSFKKYKNILWTLFPQSHFQSTFIHLSKVILNMMKHHPICFLAKTNLLYILYYKYYTDRQNMFYKFFN